ncbi:MAG TPA: chemotaxis protein CheW [Gemmatimonadaceae bacterium]|jgi:purine-binding chemotaxis protein CheW|nr:chemotaxis protein CheW [Gemmatimonadaceae bacterium]
MTSNSGDDEAAVLSIEDFAASIAASLAVTAQTASVEGTPAAAGERLSFRERVRRRTGAAQVLVFRVARELFAVELITAEEALDMPELHRLPEMPPSMLGVFTLRGSLVSVFEPQAALGVRCQQRGTVVVFCGGERRIAIAADDVDDVITVDLRNVREAPGTRTKDEALLGIVHRDSDLIALLDAHTLVAEHRPVTSALNEPVEEPV